MPAIACLHCTKISIDLINVVILYELKPALKFRIDFESMPLQWRSGCRLPVELHVLYDYHWLLESLTVTATRPVMVPVAASLACQCQWVAVSATTMPVLPVVFATGTATGSQ